jgi:excisionase family DNA binding protein
MTSREWMTVVEVAQALNVSTRTVRRWLKAGMLQAEFQPGPRGRQHAISAGQVRALRDERQREAVRDLGMEPMAFARAITEQVREHCRQDVRSGVADALESLSRDLDLRFASISRELTGIRHELGELQSLHRAARVEVQDIRQSPNGYIGREVRIVGRMTGISADSIVIVENDLPVIDGTGTLSRDSLAGTPLIDVTGTLRMFDIADAKRELRIDLDDQSLAAFTGQPVLIARFVRLTP